MREERETGRQKEGTELEGKRKKEGTELEGERKRQTQRGDICWGEERNSDRQKDGIGIETR